MAKPNDTFHTPANQKYPQQSDDDPIDPVPPTQQTEDLDPFFSQAGDDQNAKFTNQRTADDDGPDAGGDVGDFDGDAEPPDEAILHEVDPDNTNLADDV